MSEKRTKSNFWILYHFKFMPDFTSYLNLYIISGSKARKIKMRMNLQNKLPADFFSEFD